MDSGDESDDKPMYIDMLEDIRDRSQSLTNANMREICYKRCDRIRQRQPELKGALKATRNMSKVLHKVFVKDISQDLPTLGEFGSEVSHFIPEPRDFAEVKFF